MRRKLGLTAALVVTLAIAGYAQKADFSGMWTPDVDPAAAAAGGGGGRGMGGGPMTVKQTATELSVERSMAMVRVNVVALTELALRLGAVGRARGSRRRCADDDRL